VFGKLQGIVELLLVNVISIDGSDNSYKSKTGSLFNKAVKLMFGLIGSGGLKWHLFKEIV